MEHNEISINKKKFNRLLYLFSLLFILMASFSNLMQPADISGMTGKSIDEIHGYIVGLIFGKIIGIIILSFLLYFLLNWFYLNIVKKSKDHKIMEQTNQTVEVTWGIAVRIWWWIMWRSVLSGMIGGFFLGLVVGFILGFIGVSSVATQIVSAILGGVLGTIINIYFIRRIIGQKIKNFTLVLLK